MACFEPNDMIIDNYAGNHKPTDEAMKKYNKMLLNDEFFVRWDKKNESQKYKWKEV